MSFHALWEAELDLRAVTFGEMLLSTLRCLWQDAALDWDLVAEHLPDGFSERFGAVDHEQQPLLDIQAPDHQVRQQRAGNGGILGAARPQTERELVALGGDPERDDICAALVS